MQLVIVSNELLRKELLSHGIQERAELVWLADLNDCLRYPDADAVIDLLFEPESGRIRYLKQLSRPIIINSVTATCNETDPSFVRINGWPTFLQSGLIESAAHEEKKRMAEKLFSIFNKTVEWVPDIPGFITPRIICMMIQEAFLALAEGVSSKEEINTAMKLGTAYPFGPFEWAEKIGMDRIKALLHQLGVHQDRYNFAPFPFN